MIFSQSSIFNGILRLWLSISFLLLGFRMLATGTDEYFFLLWNLFLAAIPYLAALLYERSVRVRAVFSFGSGVIFFLWLFFFPNAPYIVTDFVHLPWEYWRSVSFAYDFLLVSAFSLSGLLFALGSIFRVHRALDMTLGMVLSGLVVGAVVFLSGVGMYLGRFLRWNSWDIVTNPLAVLSDTLSHYGDPAWFARAAILSLSFSAFIGISYGIFLFAYRLLRGKNRASGRQKPSRSPGRGASTKNPA